MKTMQNHHGQRLWARHWVVLLPRYLMLRSVPPQSTFGQNTNFTLLIRSSFEKQMCLISNPVILTTICCKLPELWPHLHCWYWYTSARHCSITPQNRPIVRKAIVSYLFRWSGTRGSGRWHDSPKVTQLVWGGAGELTAEQTGRFFISGAQPSSYKIRGVTFQDFEDVAKNRFAKKKKKMFAGHWIDFQPSPNLRSSCPEATVDIKTLPPGHVRMDIQFHIDEGLQRGLYKDMCFSPSTYEFPQVLRVPRSPIKMHTKYINNYWEGRKRM